MNELTKMDNNAPAPAGVMATAMQSREVAQIQAQMVVAQRFPRDPMLAIDRIKTDCQRPGLAEKAVYSYSRGGSDVSGPSIHLAKAIARRWGNIISGITELEQRRTANGGESVCEAFALDLETNYRESKIFTVPHIRYTRNGSRRLEDPRDIYELVANNGARRERACLLAIIPADVVEDAVAECEKTLKTTADTSPAAMQKMVEAFAAFSVTKEQIEQRIQRRLDAITPAQVVNLRNIYNSLRDGMSTPAEWFEAAAPTAEEKPKSGAEKVAEKLAANTGENLI